MPIGVVLCKREVEINVIDTKLGTTISNNEITVLTIEHLMASLYSKNVDNVYVFLV